jgi:excisionase family DNA binding protein
MCELFVELAMKINNASEQDEEFCTTSYAAKLLKISIGTVQTLVKKDELRAWKTGGGHRRIALRSILDYQEAHKLANESEADSDNPHTILKTLKAPKLAKTRKALKLLMVEDEAPARALFKGTLDKWKLPIDYTVKASAMEALIEISSLHPDVLITDLKMPGVDGFELLRILRANPAFSNIHLIALTSLSEDEVSARGGLPENTIYLQKPADMSWLNGYFVALIAARRNRSLL